MFKVVIFTPYKIQETEAEANRFGLRFSMRFPFPQEFMLTPHSRETA